MSHAVYANWISFDLRFSASLCLLIALADGPLPNLILPQNAALLLLAAVQWVCISLPSLSDPFI